MPAVVVNRFIAGESNSQSNRGIWTDGAPGLVNAKGTTRLIEELVKGRGVGRVCNCERAQGRRSNRIVSKIDNVLTESDGWPDPSPDTCHLDCITRDSLDVKVIRGFHSRSSGSISNLNLCGFVCRQRGVYMHTVISSLQCGATVPEECENSK